MKDHTFRYIPIRCVHSLLHLIHTYKILIRFVSIISWFSTVIKVMEPPEKRKRKKNGWKVKKIRLPYLALPFFPFSLLSLYSHCFPSVIHISNWICIHPLLLSTYTYYIIQRRPSNAYVLFTMNILSVVVVGVVVVVIVLSSNVLGSYLHCNWITHE